jgi:predicted ATPase/class 3 adenylate cyclase/Tfp pilus assembly protein PilF
MRTLLFTDVVDSTRLVERLGDARAAELWAAHDRRGRALLVAHRGHEIDRTDGFFLLFDEPADAVRYALAYHAMLADLGLAARVGIHAGAVTVHENSAEAVAHGAKRVEAEGLAKPLAARIMALAGGGQTLLSAAARDALAGRLPDATSIEAHGHYRLKGIEEPVAIFEVGTRGVAPFAPPADVDKAYRVVHDDGVWRPVREVGNNLPAERDVFVGRKADLGTLAARLDGGVRLVTVLGPGGTGKTRLVRRYGRTWLGDWPGGVWFCDLSEARSFEGILGAVAVALDVPLGKDDPVVQLGHAIAGRGRCLVILDNFEQIVAHAAATVGVWLDRAVDASFVVTSRERLHLPGEELLALEPLPVTMDAIDLFVARARAQRPGFALDDGNREAIAEAARLLDGLPLAIELAAARMRMLSPAQLVAKLRDRFQVLAGPRGASARQATLRAAIDWSWDLLAPWEQAAFAQCSVFEGGFTLEAAEAVLDLSGWPDAPVAMDAVQALLDKSLLRTWVPREQGRYDIEEPYFGMYISIHEYAEEKLRASAPAGDRPYEARHGRYFARFGADDALEALFRHGGAQRRQTLALELDNLVAACRRAVRRGDGPVAVAAYRAAWQVLEFQGPFSLGVALGMEAIALIGADAALGVPARIALAQALRLGGRVDDARGRLAEARSLAETAGDPRLQANVLAGLGILHREQGRMIEARDLLGQARVLADAAGDRRAEGGIAHTLGLLHREQGRIDAARAHFETALAIARAMGNEREEGVVLGSLGLLESEQGPPELARRHLEAALAIARKAVDRGLEGAVLANLGNLEADQGLRDASRQHTTAALAIHEAIGNRRLAAIALGNLGALLSEQGSKDEALEHFAAALAIAREVGNRRHESFLRLSLGILHHDQGRSDEAGAEYAAALGAAREVGDRRGEGIALGRLGALHGEAGRLAEADAALDAALALARAGGHRRLEGVVLGGLADVRLRQGRGGEATELLRAGEALLRELSDREVLATLLCIRGRAELAAGERSCAVATLGEAEAMAVAMRSSPDTELGRGLAALRAALA